MRSIMLILSATILVAAPLQAFTVDHTYRFQDVPDSILNRIKASNDVVHYAHRSDGSAVPFGLGRLAEMDSRFAFRSGSMSMPSATPPALKFWDGMINGDYVVPDDYWATHTGRSHLATILNNNPRIKFTSWTWCNEDDYWDFTGVATGGTSLTAYFYWMDSLERAFPHVTFIYQTAAIREPDGGDRAHQAEFNARIRTWAKENNKILFDFADLDAWHNGERNQVQIGDTLVDYLHPSWAEGFGATTGDHHANDSMGIDKGKAWWTLMARLYGYQVEGPSSIGSNKRSRGRVAYQFKWNGSRVIIEKGNRRWNLSGRIEESRIIE